jgi:hypothetical protein
MMGSAILVIIISVADPGSGAFLPPRSGIRIRDEFFPDLESRIFLTMTKTKTLLLKAVLWIRIRKDPKLFAGSGSVT